MRLLLICLLVKSIWAECDEFRFASYYGSHMVLQRAPSQAVIWGYAGFVGDKVTLEMTDQSLETYAYKGDFGNVVWRLMLEPIEDEGPFTIMATSGGCTLTLNDVLFGDVWLCSGQSNMVFPLKNVRTLRVNLTYSDEPLEDLHALVHNWVLPTKSITQSFSAICWLFGKELAQKYGRPVGLIQSAYGGTRIEAWSSSEALNVCFPEGPRKFPGGPSRLPPNKPSATWNAMIHPLVKMPIYGTLWYQGESNNANPESYGCALNSMVNDWRRRWHRQTHGQTHSLFPFGQVQLAPSTPEDTEIGFPDLRWEQTYEFGFTPNSNMKRIFTAVAMDLPDFKSPNGSVHPRHKRDIADRLFLGGLQVAYGDRSEGRFQGPLPTSAQMVGGVLRIYYDNGEPLDVRTGGIFEICCGLSQDFVCGVGQWSPASFTHPFASRGRVDLRLPCDQNRFVTGFRYAWRQSPCLFKMCALYSSENSLPAPPYVAFRLFTPGKRVYFEQVASNSVDRFRM